MLTRVDAIGFLGIASVGVGLLLFFLGRGNPAHAHIWRDWLLGFILVVVGGALAIAWPLIRLANMRDSQEETPPASKAAAKAAGQG